MKNAMVRQVIQNLIVFAGILFAHQWFYPSAVFRTLCAFAILTLCSYAVKRTVSDIEGANGDAKISFLDTLKRWPGWLGKTLAVTSLLALAMNPVFFVALFLYSCVALAHDLWFRRWIIIDVISLAVEFSLKAMVGVFALKDVELSPWLVACTFLLSLVVSLGKRRNEFRDISTPAKPGTAATTGYDAKLLDQMMAVVTSSSFVAYTLYTISHRTRTVLGNTHFLYTTPIVLFCILRYLYLVHHRDLSEGSEIAIFKDFPMVFAIFSWLVTIVVILQIS